jgi:hypothetical protein
MTAPIAQRIEDLAPDHSFVWTGLRQPDQVKRWAS